MSLAYNNARVHSSPHRVEKNNNKEPKLNKQTIGNNIFIVVVVVAVAATAFVRGPIVYDWITFFAKKMFWPKIYDIQSRFPIDID